MKQYILLISTLIFCVFRAHAQEPIREQNGNSQEGGFQKGENSIKLIFGYPSRLADVASITTTATITPGWVDAIAYDYGISKHMSLGGYLAYSSVSWEEQQYVNIYFTNTVRYTSRAVLVCGRLVYHFNFDSPIDFYAGTALGLGHFTETGMDPINLPVFDLYAGGRYFFNDNVGIFGQLGFELSVVKAGVDFKF